MCPLFFFFKFCQNLQQNKIVHNCIRDRVNMVKGRGMGCA